MIPSSSSFFLSRKQHDAVLTANQPLLQRAFAECRKRSWSLAGVTFHGLPETTVAEIQEVLK